VSDEGLRSPMVFHVCPMLFLSVGVSSSASVRNKPHFPRISLFQEEGSSQRKTDTKEKIKGSKLCKDHKDRTFIAVLRHQVPDICFPREKKFSNVF
jgi:hypothetical protein